MPTVPATRRLSPKVRRLLREHRLQARSVAGTGTGGRLTPEDVLRAAGRADGGAPRRVLASPLARRVLRDAGVDLDAAARANDGRRLTRRDADRVLDELGTVAASTSTEPRPPVDVTEIEVDASLLLAGVAALNRDFVVRHGFEVSAGVALASAVANVLVRRPDLAAAPTGTPDGGIHVGFARPGSDGAGVAVVPDAQYLTVAGLARRARDASAVATRPTVVVAMEAAAQGDLAATADLGLLTIGDPAPRRVAGVDDLGHEVVHTRPHVPIRLHRHGPTAAADGTALLEELGATIRSWALPVGP